ncbi:MAG: 23S rRNA (uracil(1939)-C(5))-methyltransferase RlmD, partial [Blastocatellia bacterium]
LYTEVVGVESDHDAAGFALENIAGHGVANVRIINNEAENFARSYAAKMRDSTAREPDLVVLDPPRTGAAEVIPYLIDIAPRRIVYVSCEPTTLARDLRSLIDAGYALARITGYDLFPQTYHVETVAALEKR